MLHVDLRPGEGFEIDGRVTIRIVQKSGQATRFTVDGPSEVPVRVLNGKEAEPTSLARQGLTKT